MRAFNSPRSSALGASGTLAQASAVQATPASWRSNWTVRIDRSCMRYWTAFGLLRCNSTAGRSCESISRRREAGKVIGQDFNVFFRKQLRHRGHVPVEVGAGPGLEAAQLRSQIGELLAREPRNVLQAQKRRAMALHAVVLLGEASSGGRVFRRGLVRRGRRFLPREIRRELVHVRVREAGGPRRHLRILAVALAEQVELQRDGLRRLTGEGRLGRVGRISAGAVADDAGLRFLRDFFGGERGASRDKRGGKHRRRAAVTATHLLP